MFNRSVQFSPMRRINQSMPSQSFGAYFSQGQFNGQRVGFFVALDFFIGLFIFFIFALVFLYRITAAFTTVCRSNNNNNNNLGTETTW